MSLEPAARDEFYASLILARFPKKAGKGLWLSGFQDRLAGCGSRFTVDEESRLGSVFYHETRIRQLRLHVTESGL
jgi:hypothetical protein